MDIRIDRLGLQVPGMHPDAARDFGRLLAEHLAAALAAAPPGPDSVPLVRLRVSVPWPAAQPPGSGRPVTAAPVAAAEIARVLRDAAAGRAPVTR
jgi:hypothetical protein